MNNKIASHQTSKAKLQLRMDAAHFAEYRQLLREQMLNYNIAQVGSDGDKESLFFGYYNDANELVAGLTANLNWGEFYLDLLWVREDYRRQKLGSALLQEAQKQALARHALYLTVNTATFQALDFYLKQQFTVFAKLPILVPGRQEQYNYFLIKYL